MIVVIATARASTGREEELRAALAPLVAVSRAEPGCLQYDMHVGLTDPQSVAFYERWESAEALAAHFTTPHFAAVMAKAGALLEGQPTIAQYRLDE